MRQPLVVSALALAFVGAASSVSSAQQEAFVGAVRDLARSVTTSSAESRGRAIERMAAALREWDRRIADRESGVARELRGASAKRAFQLHVELGLMYAARGRLVDASREFDAAADAEPAASDVHVLRALALEAASKPEDARRAFRRAWEFDQANPIKAYYLLRDGGTTDPPRAWQALVEAYQRTLTERPGPHGTPFLMLGAINDALSRTPVVGDATVAEGFTLLAAGAYADAVAALRRPARHGADSPLATFTNARALEAESRVAEARRAYEAAVAGTLAGRSLLHVGIGRLAQVDGDLAAAITSFRRASRLNPNDQILHRELALALAADGRRDEAFAELVAALLIDAGDVSALAAIGQLRVDEGRYADAAVALRRALQLAPERFETHYALAMALTHMGDTAAAAAELDRFERARRQQVEQRRRELNAVVEQEEAIRQKAGDRDGAR